MAILLALPRISWSHMVYPICYRSGSPPLVNCRGELRIGVPQYPYVEAETVSELLQGVGHKSRDQ